MRPNAPVDCQAYVWEDGGNQLRRVRVQTSRLNRSPGRLEYTLDVVHAAGFKMTLRGTESRYSETKSTQYQLVANGAQVELSMRDESGIQWHGSLSAR